MRRIVVVGGLGFFGGAATELLRDGGLAPLVAARHEGGDLRIDAEDPASIRAGLRPGDIVIDTAGPFQDRTAALAEAAIAIGFDLIDISDGLDHALALQALEERIDRAGIRVLTSCSSISTIVAALVRLAGGADPRHISVFLAPAAGATATAGTGRSLLRSLGRSIRVLRGGRLVAARGWSESRKFRMPPPIGSGRGYLMESADAASLPRIWPALREADLWVDSRVPGLNAIFSLAARAPAIVPLLERLHAPGAALARLLGPAAGGMLVEIESPRALRRVALVARRRSYLVAVAPAVMAARSLVEGRFGAHGLVPQDRHVEPLALLDYLARLGIECVNL